MTTPRSAQPRERLDVFGRARLALYDATGALVASRAFDNEILATGREFVANLFVNPALPFTGLQLGVGTADASETVQVAEATGQVSAVEKFGGGEATRAVATVQATLPALNDGNTHALTWASILLVQPGAEGEPGRQIPYNRAAFPVVHKGPNMSMTLTWEVVF
jgi:hypothetical protein